MKLEEMGIVGLEAKIADTAPSHAGEVGRIISMSTERAYIQFGNGDKEWFANKHIVGTRKPASDVASLQEMASKAVCSKCGKGPMSKTHHWYKGSWQCKKGDSAPAEKKDDDKSEKKHKTAAELGLAKRDEPKMSDSMRKANEEAANKRAATFRDQLEKDIAAREAKKK